MPGSSRELAVGAAVEGTGTHNIRVLASHSVHSEAPVVQAQRQTTSQLHMHMYICNAHTHTHANNLPFSSSHAHTFSTCIRLLAGAAGTTPAVSHLQATWGYVRQAVAENLPNMCQAVAENLPIIRKRIACWPACEKLLDGRHFRITEMFKPGSKDIYIPQFFGPGTPVISVERVVKIRYL